MTKLVVTMDGARPAIRARRRFRTALRHGHWVSMSGHTKRPGSAYVDPLPSGWAIVRPRGQQEQDVTHRFTYTYGNLPGAYYESFEQASYAVYSYATPIAWWIDIPAPDAARGEVEAWLLGTPAGHWVEPAVKYSVTTTKHQHEVRSAMSSTWRQPDEESLPHVTLALEGASTSVPSGTERVGWW